MPAAAAGARAAAGVRAAIRAAGPVRRLTVLYDPGCGLCTRVAGWLAKQRKLVPLDLVPVGSAEARRRFPALDHAATVNEITVVGDGGQVYRGDSAWVVCLWALSEHREFSHTLSTPAGRRLARAAVLAAAKYRGAGRHTTRPAAGAGWAGTGRAGTGLVAPDSRGRYVYAPGWVYDPVSGWTQDDGAAAAGSGARGGREGGEGGACGCADGCAAPG